MDGSESKRYSIAGIVIGILFISFAFSEIFIFSKDYWFGIPCLLIGLALIFRSFKPRFGFWRGCALVFGILFLSFVCNMYLSLFVSSDQNQLDSNFMMLMKSHPTDSIGALIFVTVPFLFGGLILTVCGFKVPDIVEDVNIDSYGETSIENAVQTNEDYGGSDRLTFFWRLLFLFLFGGISGMLSVFAESTQNIFLLLLSVACPIIALIILFLITQSRLMNIGYSQWWALLWIVPIVGILVFLTCMILPEGFKDSHKLDRMGITMIPISVFIVICMSIVGMILLL